MTVTELEFETSTAQYRRELLAHCYRMLGSIHDAEDLVQETYLRAWGAFGRFEGRSSVRFWLYKIATMACLTALDGRRRRPLPAGLGAPSDDPRTSLVRSDTEWLEPAPDSILLPASTSASASASADPADIAGIRAGVRLAFIAALQHLPARQRAVLILRDVLAWRAAEVAECLGTTTTAVNSALQRARAQLATIGPIEDSLIEPDDPDVRAALDGYVTAFEHADIPGLVRLLRADVELEMPPFSTWFTGRDAVAGFLSAQVVRAPAGWLMLPLRANGQPAVAAYERQDDGTYHGHAIHLLTFLGPRISRIVAFIDPSLIPSFGLRPVVRPTPR